MIPPAVTLAAAIFPAVNMNRIGTVCRLSILMMVLMIGHSASAQVLFEDDLGAASEADWFELGSFDAIAQFGYDYSADGIPPAPNGSDTVGLKTEVNIFESFVNEIALVHEDPSFTGQFTVQVDIWNNWFPNEGAIGTTEFTGAGVGHDGFTIGPDGALLAFDGDGGATRDYRLYKNFDEQFIESGQYAVEGQNNTDPAFVEAFPGFDVNEAVPDQGLTGAVPDGAAGFQWMTMMIDVDTEAIGIGITQDPGLATFSLTSALSGNTVTVGTIDNSNGGDVVNMEGSVALFMFDLFSSVSPSPAHSFGLFDNVLVTTGDVGGGETIPGDYNDNGRVEQADLDLVLLNWNESVDMLPADWINERPTGGIIDQAELDGVLLNWNRTTPGLGTAAAVPEPGTFLSALLALGALLAVRRFRHRTGR